MLLSGQLHQLCSSNISAIKRQKKELKPSGMFTKTEQIFVCIFLFLMNFVTEAGPTYSFHGGDHETDHVIDIVNELPMQS